MSGAAVTPDPIVAAPRRLDPLEHRPGPTLFARASALTLFTDEPQPQPDPVAEAAPTAPPSIPPPIQPSVPRSALFPDPGPAGPPERNHTESNRIDPTGPDHRGRAPGRPHRSAGHRFLLALVPLLAVVLVVAVALTLQQRLRAPVSTADAAPQAVDATSTTAESSWASAGLSVAGSLHAAAYFGRITGITDELGGRVDFGIDQTFLAAHPDICALTVVFTGVQGKLANAYAMDLGPGWRSPESPPAEKVSADDSAVHHQVVTPPEDVTAGASWMLSALIEVDGQQSATGSYPLTLTGRDGSQLTWSFGGSTVVCSLT